MPIFSFKVLLYFEFHTYKDMRQNTNIVSAYFDLADHLNFFCVLNRIKKKIHDQKIQ